MSTEPERDKKPLLNDTQISWILFLSVITAASGRDLGFIGVLVVFVISAAIWTLFAIVGSKYL